MKGCPSPSCNISPAGPSGSGEIPGEPARPGPARCPDGSQAWPPRWISSIRKNYINRDVKPANVLFDAHGHAFLSDFGVAKVISDVEASAKRGAAMTGMG